MQLKNRNKNGREREREAFKVLSAPGREGSGIPAAVITSLLLFPISYLPLISSLDVAVVVLSE